MERIIKIIKEFLIDFLGKLLAPIKWLLLKLWEPHRTTFEHLLTYFGEMAPYILPYWDSFYEKFQMVFIPLGVFLLVLAAIDELYPDDEFPRAVIAVLSKLKKRVLSIIFVVKIITTRRPNLSKNKKLTSNHRSSSWLGGRKKF